MPKFALVDIIGTRNDPNGNSRRLYRIVDLGAVRTYEWPHPQNISGHKANAETTYVMADGSGIMPVPKGYTRINGTLLFVSPSDWRNLAKRAELLDWKRFDKAGGE